MPMLALDLDAADLLIDGDQIGEVSSLEEIRQHLWIRLHLHLGEIPYQTDIGVPFADEVMAAGVAPERVVQIYRDIILETPGVVSFLDEPTLEFDATTRSWSLSFRVDTDEGELSDSFPILTEPEQEVE